MTNFGLCECGCVTEGMANFVTFIVFVFDGTVSKIEEVTAIVVESTAVESVLDVLRERLY